MDVKTCTFYVFVARDRDEFGKYSLPARGFKSFRMKGVDVLWKRKDTTVVLVLSCVAKRNPTEVTTLCHYVAAVIISLGGSEGEVETIHKELTERDSVSIFVHWGGDGWGVHEETAQEALKNGAYKNWSVFAISSTRTDIGVEPGRIPDSKEALEDIVYRCKDAATDQILMHLAMGSSPTGKDYKEKIEERLKRLKSRLLLSSLKTDKKRKVLEEIQQAIKAIESEQEAELKKVAPFLAKILSKEVFHG